LSIALLAAGPVVTSSKDASSSSSSAPPPSLDLEAFEDSDCIEDPNAELLLTLMSHLCDVLETTLYPELVSSQRAWNAVRKWKEKNGQVLLKLVSSVFARPYCEPGKVAGTTATCLMLIDEPGGGTDVVQALECVTEVEAMLQDTVSDGKSIYDTRLHMFLRSPWPTFRLLDVLVTTWPEKDAHKAAMDLGSCEAHRNLMGEDSEFDWEWFKSALNMALSSALADESVFRLDPSDGPMSEQYRERWSRVFRLPSFREAAAFGSDCFYKYRRQQWEAGCHPGVVASYLMQCLTFSTRDTGGWLQRYVGASWNLLNLLTPLSSLIHSDWPVFRALYLGSILRRGSLATGVVRTEDEPRAGRAPARALEDRLNEVLDPGPETIVYASAAWGDFATAEILGAFLARWSALKFPKLLMLALDSQAAKTCHEKHLVGRVECVEVPQRFGTETVVAKYLTLAYITLRGTNVAWVDLDVYLPADPTTRLQAALTDDPNAPPLVFSGFLTSASLNPSLIMARGGEEASELLRRFAAWLYENPFILDHQGWDEFLQNPDGDFSGSWDYKGRNITSGAGDGLELSFAPAFVMPAQRPASANGKRSLLFTRLGPEFASADGWRGPRDQLASFHFWGAAEKHQELFEAFYPYESVGFSPAARAVLARYRREPISRDAASIDARKAVDADLHITTISYADGCCVQSIARNRQSALDVGVDLALAYGRSDLDQEWAEQHASVLTQKKGAGWWLWKPHVVLKTLRDDAVPWHTGVVLWLDAGNQYIGDPRPVVARALRDSDVSAMRLKCCVESDWTSDRALRKLGGKSYVISDRPQLGAYFLIFRKTTTTLAFVEDWLRLSEDPDILMEPGARSSVHTSAGYQRHMADQSVFSVLFKQRGFQAMSLEEGHKVVQLDRWRE